MLLGFIFCFLVGFLWTCVGVFYKMMAQWKLSIFDISLVTCPCTLILTILFYTKTGAFLSGELHVLATFRIMELFRGHADKAISVDFGYRTKL